MDDQWSGAWRLSRRVVRLEDQVHDMTTDLYGSERNPGGLVRRLDSVDRRLGWLLGLFIGGLVTVIGALLARGHW